MPVSTSPSSRGPMLALTAAFLGWLFDGFEIGLFPVVARPALLSMLGPGGEGALGQDWAGDFYGEIKEQHAKGMAAAKQFVEQPRRIPCPTDECHKFVVIDAENLMSDVTCFGCKQSWTVLRLVALAMSNPNRKFFLDAEAIALWLGISQRQVHKIIKANSIERRGSLYDLAAVIANR